MKNKMIKQIGVRLSADEYSSLSEITRITTLEISTLMRLGMRKIISEWNEKGQITLNRQEKDHEETNKLNATGIQKSIVRKTRPKPKKQGGTLGVGNESADGRASDGSILDSEC